MTLVIITFLLVVTGRVTGTAPGDLVVDQGSHLDDEQKLIRISTYQKMIFTGILVTQMIIIIAFLLPLLLIIITTTERGDQTRRAPRTTRHRT